jgi:hypothetical protein
LRLDELISKKDKYKSVQHTIGKRPQAKEQTTNHKAAPLPGVFLGEESILYTGKNIRRCCASGVFFLLCVFIIGRNRFGSRMKPLRIKHVTCTDINTKTA